MTLISLIAIAYNKFTACNFFLSSTLNKLIIIIIIIIIVMIIIVMIIIIMVIIMIIIITKEINGVEKFQR